MARLRALIPTWRFFDDDGGAAVLELRHGPSADQLGAWHDAVPREKRRIWQLLFNPRGNYVLTCHGLVERLVHEVAASGPGSVATSTTYRQVRALAREHAPSGAVWQFRVILREFGLVQAADAGDTHEVLVSPVEGAAHD